MCGRVESGFAAVKKTSRPVVGQSKEVAVGTSEMFLLFGGPFAVLQDGKWSIFACASLPLYWRQEFRGHAERCLAVTEPQVYQQLSPLPCENRCL